MTVAKRRLKKNVQDRRQERKFFIVIGIVTLLLIIALFLIYG